ncbi:two pore domain potassium channel family protein [Candidatus Woesearchaeota archaeon]|nr:two pore domain potassium channel family protein [Candidatus Woesearchaeota archaeon]
MKQRISTLITIFLVFAILLTGATVYHNLERWSWVDSFYFSATTLTTVGFGDLHPTTDASKIFTIFYVIVGVSVVLYMFSKIIVGYFEGHGATITNSLMHVLNKKKKPERWIELKVKKEK